jgi:hypothetical protein
MVKPEDIHDAAFREAILEADSLLNSGDYTKAAVKCAETYVELLRERPEMMPAIVRAGGVPVGPDSSGRLPGPTEGGAEIIAARRAMWPRTGGINLVVGEDRRPGLSYEKERFSFSEAATYFEFLLAELARSETQPAG